ncbi:MULTISPECIES: hypothetical protein [Haloarcula]|uniref:Blue (type 1) copper domain-containing protein n=1 Tax=Haloarcula pellucida TaxID=1427151 RepID=A0A830GI42_9EURY|nr:MULTISPECIES: hypothetical protein [Halomicroarcula]MBX0347862.1 hypothetical protein [Halomicroarcula pellucida]MDS0276204.1 hypothetical protein [Halomicroarcula sp. S1AR25-4]GGN90637.1 hypothetical protein GCM10009030_12870 [Halomicroarcula pellucida]
MGQYPPDSSRRDVMKALGAGAVLSGLGGTATAQADDGQQGGGGEQETDGRGTVHEVQTLIQGPPTNPNRPADFFYQPTGLHVQPGDVVKFVFTTPDHNVVAYHPAFGMRRRVPTGVTAYSSPLLGWRPESIADDQIEPPAETGGGEGETGGGGEGGGGAGADQGEREADGPPEPVPDTWLQAFETPGVYDMLCSPHEGFGMALRVVVGDVTEAPFETSTPENLAEPRTGPVGLARVTLTDPALQPTAIVEQGAVDWQDLEANQAQSGESEG